MRHLVCILLSCAIVALAFHYAEPLPKLPQKEEFLPKAEYAKALAMGHNVTASGLFWISGIIDLGESYLYGTSYAWLSHVGNLSTELDSLFRTPYNVVGSITNNDEPDTTDFIVMRRAVRVYPDDWRLAVYFALRLANSPTHNYAEAAKIMKHFSTSKDTTIPPHIKSIYRNFELNTMQTEMALEMLINDALNPQFKDLIKGFTPKTLRALHRTGEPDTNIVNEVSFIMKKLSEHAIDPNYAYQRLLSFKKEEPANSASAKEPDTTTANDTATIAN